MRAPHQPIRSVQHSLHHTNIPKGSRRWKSANILTILSNQHVALSKQAPSYASAKLRLTQRLTGVKCRATSVAKKNIISHHTSEDRMMKMNFYQGKRSRIPPCDEDGDMIVDHQIQLICILGFYWTNTKHIAGHSASNMRSWCIKYNR